MVLGGQPYVAVKSAPGQGAEFTVVLHKLPPAQRGLEEEASRHP